MTRHLLLCLAISIMPALALAQAAPPPPPPTHEGSVEASYVGVSGNASSNTFGFGADQIARPGTLTIRNRFAFVRNEADGVLTANAFDYKGRVQKALNARLAAFGEYQYFADEFAGIDRRNSLTGGVSVKAIDDGRHALAFDLGGGYINEQRLAGDDVSSGSYLAGSAYRLKISETATLGDDLQWSGVFSNADDWRLAHTISLTTQIAAGFSLKISNGLRYAHFPPPGFKTTDSVTSVALVAKFARP